MFHANYTVGLQNKITLLNLVKQNNDDIVNSQNDIDNIKILTAYYGCHEDVTDKVKKSDSDSILIDTKILETDPMPGLHKSAFILDKDNNLLDKAIGEGHYLYFDD
tara:strand:- start:772 stop:1089 length:318 start_codon:yes stop_codon:yes gene_type:complete